MFDDEAQEVIRQIKHGPRPWATLNVWLAVLFLTDFQSSVIRASAAEIAQAAEVPPAEAYRALSRLAEIGAIVRVGRGRYKINERVAYRGNLKLAAQDGAPVA